MAAVKAKNLTTATLVEGIGNARVAPGEVALFDEDRAAFLAEQGKVQIIVEGSEEERAEEEGPVEWTISMTPEQYLEKYPKGPNADKARAVIAQKAAEAAAVVEEEQVQDEEPGTDGEDADAAGDGSDAGDE